MYFKENRGNLRKSQEKLKKTARLTASICCWLISSDRSGLVHNGIRSISCGKESEQLLGTLFTCLPTSLSEDIRASCQVASNAMLMSEVLNCHTEAKLVQRDAGGAEVPLIFSTA